MTSKERQERRYQRRKRRREKEKREKYSEFDNFDSVFSFENLYDSYHKCCNGVRWKASTQNYILSAPLHVYRAQKELKQGKFKSKGFHSFTIKERGKARHIRSVHISERVVQKCLCDYSLVPMLEPKLIYNNGATLKGKGEKFALNRLDGHLRKFYRKHGNNGYIWIFDFKGYFDCIVHSLLISAVGENFTDERIMRLYAMFVECFGYRGLGLGSQVSQISSVFYPTKVDKYIEEVESSYGRYMDDGYIIHHDKKFLHALSDDVKEMLSELGITVNNNKTHIYPLKRFKFLKKTISLSDSGKIHKRIARMNVTRMRRKLKIFKGKVDRGEMTVKQVASWYKSWRGNAMKYNTKRICFKMDKIFGGLFHYKAW